ncbi:MAG: ABC transporter substrate-binding protein [Planctomycetes bacterium]|nr:ABC transporter substrate-binding protein [Planctomycetota bacterium]
MDVFKITASDTYLTRLPEFVAREMGYFKDVDLEVQSHCPAPWNKVLADIESGEYQAAADGIWLPSLYKHRAGDYYAFAKGASHFPMTVVARQAMPEFTWKDLEGRIVLIPGSNEAGTRMYTLGCARDVGADVGAIKYVPNFYSPMLYECFAGGWGDFIVLRTDLARTMQAEGKGHIVFDFAADGGSVPWLVYYATKRFLDASAELAGRFTPPCPGATPGCKTMAATTAAPSWKNTGPTCPGNLPWNWWISTDAPACGRERWRSANPNWRAGRASCGRPIWWTLPSPTATS